jgi:hypothetical protein
MAAVDFEKYANRGTYQADNQRGNKGRLKTIDLNTGNNLSDYEESNGAEE